MVDYYSLLNRAIASLAQPDAEARASIYGRARDALNRQLRGFEPPLSEEEIAAQLETLDAVIVRIEAEHADLAAGQPQAPLLDEPIPASPDDPGPLSTPSSTFEPTLRPRIPGRDKATESGRKKLSLFVGISIVVMLGMGLLALTRNGKPTAPAGPPVVTAPGETGSDPAKTEGRLGSAETPAAPPTAPPSAPVQPSRPIQPAETTQPPATQPSATPPTVANGVVTASTTGRAFMVLEPAPGVPNQFEGKVTWSYLPDGSLGGQKSLRALIEFSASTLSVDFSIARNNDAAINASHTLMVIFDGRNGLGNVLEMSAVEWRERENVVGGVLAGIVVPIQANVFMIGLDKTEAAMKRNLDLLRTQKWMVFEFRLENGRRGAVLVEKSQVGENALTEALRDWRQ